MDQYGRVDDHTELAGSEARKFRRLLRKRFRFLPSAQAHEDAMSIVASLRQMDRGLGRVAGDDPRCEFCRNPLPEFRSMTTVQESGFCSTECAEKAVRKLNIGIDDLTSVKSESCSFCGKEDISLSFKINNATDAYVLCSWICVMAIAAVRAQHAQEKMEKQIADLRYENRCYASGILS